MLSLLVLSVVVGVAVSLGCLLVGALLGAMAITWVVAIGVFLVKYGALFGLLAALWFFFTRRTTI